MFWIVFFENVFVHLFEFVLKMSLNILLKNYLKTCLKIVWQFSKRFQRSFKTIRNDWKNQRLTNEQFTAFRRNSPLRERLSLEAPSDNREKKKRNVFILHCEKISTFSSRAKRAHGREAPRKTQTRGSERSTENPTGAEFGPKSVPSGRRVLIFVILGKLSKEEIKRFSICFSIF